MESDPLQLVIDALWAMPFWMKATFFLFIVARVSWPELFTERVTSPRRSRRWRRRNWHD